MRHLSTKLMFALAVMLPLFYGCGNDDDGVDILSPTISEPDDIEVTLGTDGTLSYTVTTGGGFASASAVSSNPDVATVDVTAQPDDDSAEGSVTVTVSPVAAGTTTVTLTVTDDQGQSATDDAGVTVVASDEPEEPATPAVANAGTALDTIAALSTLNAAVDEIEGLTTTLDSAEAVTIFAPNNAAFTALFASLELEDGDLTGLVDTLTAPGVASVLQAHVVAESLDADAVLARVGDSLQTLNTNAKLGISEENGTLFVNGAAIVQPNITVGNGVIHIIESVVNTDATDGGVTGGGGDGSNGFTVTITNVSSDRRFFQHGTFGLAPDSTLAPANSYSFSFNAGSFITSPDLPTRLSFAASLTGEGTTDNFIATPENGILLYTDGVPLTGDISNQIQVWDADTEDEAGEDNATPGPVRLIGNAGPGTAEDPGQNVATVTVTNEGTVFTVTITNAQPQGLGISPGVFGVHTVNGPLYRSTQSAGADGLEALAEDGNPLVLGATLNRNDGFAVPLSPGVFAIHASGVSPILAPGQTAPVAGLESLAEDGDPAALAATLAAAENVDSSGVFGEAPPIGPDGSYSFQVTGVEAGDLLSLATMMVQSNDIVYSTSQIGISLFDANGQPVSGDVTNQIFAYDVGTEANEYPGAGPNQAPRQSAPNTGPADPNTVIRRVSATGVTANDDGFIYNPVSSRIQVTITPN